jgi:hypothetical protein
VAGDFNGDGKLEYIWVQSPKVDENDFGSCVGECNSQIYFSDSSIPSIEVVGSIGGVLSNLGDVPPPSVAGGFGVFRHCNGLDGQLLCVLGGRQPAQ